MAFSVRRSPPSPSTAHSPTDGCKEAGLPTNALALYLIPLGLSFLMALALFLARGRNLLKRGDKVIDIDDLEDNMPHVSNQPSPQPRGGELVGAATGTGQRAVSARPGAGRSVITTSPAPIKEPNRLEEIETTGFTPLRIVTLAGMIALLIGGAVFQLDIGVCSMVIAAVLLILAPNKHKPAVNNVTWSAVLLVCGMLTYMAVLKENGTIEFLGDAAASLGSPLLTALILCVSVAAISAVGSSIGTLGIVLPLAAPLLAMGDAGSSGIRCRTVLLGSDCRCQPVVEQRRHGASQRRSTRQGHIPAQPVQVHRLRGPCGTDRGVRPGDTPDVDVTTAPI